MNQRLWLSVIVAAAVATAISFGTAHWCNHRQAPSAISDTVDLRRVLALTDAQAAEVEKLEKIYRSQLAKCCEAHCAARADLATELGRPSPDTTQAVACCQRMCTAQSDSERFTLEHILRVRVLLTPAQQQRHAALIQQQLAGSSCSMLVQPEGN